ncbi:SGT1-domain-containing protein [Neoconidiobolus thromboides FSU 785]|nr:SGT1-domain-containing protein [Neoconidiobolus thromboides FSU 785]
MEEEGVNVINEDCIFYKIFLKKETEIQSIKESFFKLINQIRFFNKVHYIWHQQGIEFNLLELEDYNVLSGKTTFSDNIIDEWLITWAFYELSKEYKDIFISLTDNEGQFLLIETADYLENWMLPEIMDNRVYLKNGKMNIINRNKGEKILEKEGISMIMKEEFVANELIQLAFKQRIKDFPKLAQQQEHLAYAYLPLAIAKLLTIEPQLISKCLNQYYLRDPILFKKCNELKYFQLKDKVLYKVPMTRTLYAQTLFQKVPNPLPKSFLSWELENKNDNDKKWFELGFKIICGFEMLSYDFQYPIEKDSKWNLILNELIISNYFQGEQEGSEKYLILLNQAKNYYSLLNNNSNNNNKLDLNQFQLDNISLLNINLKESDIDWLNISNEELEKMLSNYQNQSVVFIILFI